MAKDLVIKREDIDKLKIVIYRSLSVVGLIIIGMSIGTIAELNLVTNSQYTFIPQRVVLLTLINALIYATTSVILILLSACLITEHKLKKIKRKD